MPDHVPTHAEAEALRGLADDWEFETDIDVLRERIADLRLALARLDEAERLLTRAGVLLGSLSSPPALAADIEHFLEPPDA